jgi:nitroimidazol reductase NimA-like FMN-containing flavoprotein (pyridoxamine 5'-phosphate oxidase superfamily)
MATPELTKTDAVTVRRRTERADYTRAAANAILDEALIAHVGISVDGQPFVIPMVFGRDGDQLVLHGSVATRLLRALDDGVAVCVTVTHVDDLVVSRSWFHMSMNYRSVVIIGTAERVRDPDVARRALACVVDHVVPGRTAEARPPTDAELRQTAVLRVPIDTASVKVRTGGPVEEPGDLELPIWAGCVPVRTAFGTPAGDDALLEGVAVPPSLVSYERPGAARS